MTYQKCFKESLWWGFRKRERTSWKCVEPEMIIFTKMERVFLVTEVPRGKSKSKSDRSGK